MYVKLAIESISFLIFFSEAGLQVDAYSRVYIASVSDGTEILHKYSMDRQLHTDMEVFKPQLAVLEKTSKLGSLVSVSGNI